MTSQATLTAKQQFVHMEGNKVFKHAVRMMPDAALRTVREAGMTADDVHLLIPHQANTRIMEATLARVGIPAERMYSLADRYGNMSAATIPVAIDQAREDGRLKDGDTLLLTAFGTGFTWAASLLRW